MNVTMAVRRWMRDMTAGTRQLPALVRDVPRLLDDRTAAVLKRHAAVDLLDDRTALWCGYCLEPYPCDELAGVVGIEGPRP